MALPAESAPTFRQELTNLINRHSMENGSDTPDFILAEYLEGCLEVFDKTVAARTKWYAPPKDEEEVTPPTGAYSGEFGDGD